MIRLFETAFLVVAALIIGFSMLNIFYDFEWHESIDACESNLPRNESCILIAVPDRDWETL